MANSKSNTKRPQQAVVRHQQVISQQIHQGPIPNSEEMMRYEQIEKGFADRIMKMAEENGAHRRALEKASTLSDIENTKI